MAFSAAKIGSKEELNVFSLKIHNGAIFCQVDKIKLPDQSKLFITEGYQLWKGDIPSFITMLTKIVNSGIDDRTGPTKKIKEAYACTKKYFIAARTLSGLAGFNIIGIKAMVFTSNLAQR